jgi:hypothetical protein
MPGVKRPFRRHYHVDPAAGAAHFDAARRGAPPATASETAASATPSDCSHASASACGGMGSASVRQRLRMVAMSVQGQHHRFAKSPQTSG